MELEKVLELYIDAGEVNKSIGIGFMRFGSLWIRFRALLLFFSKVVQNEVVT